MKPKLMVIEGDVQYLKVGADTLNLLAGQQGVSNAAAGVVGAITGQHGTAVNAAMVAAYEGEEVDRFACMIGEHLVQGVFTRVMFGDGDRVKAVVEADAGKTGALAAHAVLRPSDGLLSMPYGTGRGTFAELKKNLTWGALCAIFGYAVFGSFFYLSPPDPDDSFFVLLMLAVPAVLGFFLALWAYFADSEGEQSTAIFEALGFPNPKSLNLKPSAICPHEGYQREYGIFRYRRVVKAEDDPHGSPEPEPLKRYSVALAERMKADAGTR